MEIEHARDLFSDYFDGLLGPEQRAELEACFATDETLRSEWETFRKAMRSLSAMPTASLPVGFAHNVERRIRLRSRGRFFRQRRPVRLPFEWFSFMLILALLVLYVLMLAEMPAVKPLPDAAGSAPPATTAPGAPGRSNGKPSGPR